MHTGQMHETLLPKWLALPIFASDPLSSNAYATEEALVVLVGAAGLGAAHLVLPLTLAIAALLGIVILSYRQTVRVYSTASPSTMRSRRCRRRCPGAERSTWTATTRVAGLTSPPAPAWGARGAAMARPTTKGAT